MYRATRKLIKERSRFCSRFTPKLVKMHWVEIGEAQRCFSNSLSAKVKDVNKSGSSENAIISGWIIHAYNKQNDTTEIIQHWWNCDPILKIHFDTTPLDAGIRARSLEFVEDLVCRARSVFTLEVFGRYSGRIRDILPNPRAVTSVQRLHWIIQVHGVTSINGSKSI